MKKTLGIVALCAGLAFAPLPALAHSKHVKHHEVVGDSGMVEVAASAGVGLIVAGPVGAVVGGVIGLVLFGPAH